MKRNNGLQLARGVACLAVVLGHSGYIASILSEKVAPDWLTGQLPTFGVFLFFALSGYLMGGIAAEGRTTAGKFAWHRFVRIYPAFWATALIAVLLLAVLRLPIPAPDFAYLALLPLNAGGGAYDIPAWTLIYEVVFYVLVCGLILVKASKRTTLIAALVWAVAIFVFHSVGPAYSHVAPGRFIALSSLNLLFIAGAVVALVGARGLDRIPVAALFLGAAGLWRVGTIVDQRSAWKMLGYATSSALTLIAFSRLTPKARLLISIGDASYGIYLIHYIVLSTLLFVGRLRGVMVVSLPVAFAGLALTATALSWAYGALEHSFYRRLTAKRPKQAAVTGPVAPQSFAP
jgi:exopolysaccharide production protein ExoZ